MFKLAVLTLTTLVAVCAANDSYAYKQPSYAPAPYKQPAYQPQPYKSGYKQEEYYAHPKYDFNWAVKDDYSYNNYGQQEYRDGDKTDGSYFVLLPDGRLQQVKYYVDGYSGYVAEVTYSGEPKYDNYKPSPSYKHDSYAPAPYAPAPYAPAPAYKPAYKAPAYKAPAYKPAY